MNLLYPVKVHKLSEGLKLTSSEFNLSVTDTSLMEAVAKMKESILAKLAKMQEEQQEPPLPKHNDFNESATVFIEIESASLKFFCERVNVSIPKNLLSIVDSKVKNRSNYISNLILQDLLKNNTTL